MWSNSNSNLEAELLSTEIGRVRQSLKAGQTIQFEDFKN